VATFKRVYDWWFDQWGFPDYWDYGNMCHDEDKKATKLGFQLWKIQGLLWYCFVHKWDALLCWKFGHKPIDCSSGGPDGGNMDHECERCGEYWHVTLY
jgi:hypothetical protein